MPIKKQEDGSVDVDVNAADLLKDRAYVEDGDFIVPTTSTVGQMLMRAIWVRLQKSPLGEYLGSVPFKWSDISMVDAVNDN